MSGCGGESDAGQVIRMARFYEKECGSEKPEDGPWLGWMCTRQRGHKGRHVAHDIDGSLITTWPGGATP